MLHGMTTPQLTFVGRSSVARQRTLRLDHQSGSRDAGYRRLSAVILALDVATLAAQLRAQRLASTARQAA